jgi:hypothetical protein
MYDTRENEPEMICDSCDQDPDTCGLEYNVCEQAEYEEFCEVQRKAIKER